jgi:hypothetical protein
MNVTWIEHIPDILNELNELSVLNSSILQSLLGLTPRGTRAALQVAGARRPDGSIDRDLLVQYLRSKGAAVIAEADRRARMAKRLAAPRVMVAMPANTPDKMRALYLLPDGVTLSPGRIEIVFDNPAQGLEAAFCFSQWLGNDANMREYRERTEKPKAEGIVA